MDIEPVSRNQQGAKSGDAPPLGSSELDKLVCLHDAVRCAESALIGPSATAGIFYGLPLV